MQGFCYPTGQNDFQFCFPNFGVDMRIVAFLTEARGTRTTQGSSCATVARDTGRLFTIIRQQVSS